MTSLSALSRSALRQFDTNSLLRLYDQVKQAPIVAGSLQQRERAAKAARSIAAELEKRQVNVK